MLSSNILVCEAIALPKARLIFHSKASSMDPWTAWTECSPSVARMLFHSVATWTSTRMPCTGLIVLNLLRITPVCMMGVCRFIQPPTPKNGGFLLRHHLHPAGLSKPSVSALHSAGVTVAFEMGAGTQTLTLTLAQLVLSPVEPCHPPSPQISVRPSVVLCHVASRMGVLLEEPGSREWLKWREIVFWTVAIGDGALSLHPRCSLNVAWTSGVHSGAEWRSWVDGYWWGRDFRLTSCGVLCMWWVCHSRSVRVRGQLVGVDPSSFI